MPSPIPATAYSTPQVPQPMAFKAPSVREMPARDLFGQGASGQDLSVIGAVTGPVSTVDETSATADAGHPMFGKDGFTFSDFLDIINPLQHIPVVSTVYRAITGDKIDPGSRIIGGGLFGGPIGLVASMISGIVEESTGKDPGEHALAALGIDIGGPRDEPQTMLADGGTAQQAQPNGTTPAELAAQQAQMQAAQARMPGQDMKLGVKMDDGRGRKPAETQASAQQARSDGPIELPADLFQALKQNAATQQQDTRTTAANSATANPVQQQQMQTQALQARSSGPMQANTATEAMPNNAIRTTADGRNWYPAFPMGGGGAPTRTVGTSPVTQMNATSKFGVTKGASATPQQTLTPASTAAMLQGQEATQNEWSSRATDAYQKYFDMQNEKNRRAGIVQ